MPDTVSNTLFDRDAITIKEIIGNEAEDTLPEMSPFFWDELLVGDEASGFELGRDLLFKKRFYGSISGVARHDHLDNYSALYGDPTVSAGYNLQRQTAAGTWPSGAAGAIARPYGITGRLHAIKFNLWLTKTMMELDAIPANIMHHVVPVLRGFGKLVATEICGSFHADPDQQFRLASLGPSAGDGAYIITTADRTIRFFPPERTSHRFQVGLPVDIFSDATTRRNQTAGGVRIPLWVDSVDPYTNSVVLTTGSDDTLFDGGGDDWGTIATLGANAYVTEMDQYTATGGVGHRNFYAWRSWTVWGPNADGNAANRVLRSAAITTTVNDYIDIRQHAEFRSPHFDVNGPLTERKLLEYLDSMENGFSYWGYDADTVMLARGIVLNMFNQYQSKEIFDRGSTPGALGRVQPMGARGGFSITSMSGKTYTGATNPFLETGTAVVMRRRGNWAIISPPKGAGIQRGGGNGLDVPSKIPLDFLMPALGASSIKWPVQLTSSGDAGAEAAVTELCQIPSYTRMQIVPTKQIPAMVLEGITESRMYSTF